MKRADRPFVLLMFLGMVLAAPVFAFPHEYQVEPAFGTIGTAAADVVPVTFWELSLREMVIISALAISPALVFPLEIFFAVKLLSCFGFRRIARNNILASPVRNAIYTIIRSRPGISFVRLLDEVNISRGALTYHLALMRITGKILPLEEHGITGYFENSGRYNRNEQKLLKYLRQDTDRQILISLTDHPFMSRSDLVKAIGISGPTVTWHMKRLIGDGLLDLRKDGRFSRYTLSEWAKAGLEYYSANPQEQHAGVVVPQRYPARAQAAEM